MCGICGIYGGFNNEERRQLLAYMMATLEHRGPDDSGSYLGEACLLGHQRLSILDLSSKGHQPMCNEDETVWSVVNGEIYNYKELREMLRQLGHAFRSECDSEVIVHAYETYGEKFVEHLRGMFALAVYNQGSRQLILARDPSGKKPLYYAWQHNNLYFASEIKALLAGGVPCRVNYAAIPAHLMYQYIPGDQTLFEEVNKLPAGHTLILQESQVGLHRYWQVTDAKQYHKSKAVEVLRTLLEESVELRLQSDVPVGAFLSGGIDSSAVVALWRRKYSGPIHTFTAYFGKEVSETPWARRVSSHLETEYHEIEITPTMVAENIDKITWHHDEPLGDAAIINNYFLAREAKKYVTVVLAGEGGDEIFGGYPWHRYARLAMQLNRVARPARDMVKGIVMMSGAGDPTSLWYALGRMTLLPCQDTEIDTLLYSTTATSTITLDWLLKDALYPRSALDLTVATIPDKIGDPYNLALAMDYLNLLPEKFLMKADKATMAWAVEERLPLLDQEVVKAAFAIRPWQKQDKWVLRKAVEDLLPKEIVWRPKRGFGTPVASWLQSVAMRERVETSLRDGKLLREVCRSGALDKLAGLATKPGGRAALSPLNVVWGLFALQVWHDVWFKK